MYKPLLKGYFNLILFILITLITSLNLKVYAKFLIEQDITYKVLDDYNTKVIKNITLTNLEDDIIATNYSFETKQLDIYDVIGIEDGKNMVVKKASNTDKVLISAIFNDVSIGKGTTKSFTIEYKTSNIISKTGKIFSLNIPKAHISNDITLYNVKLEVPDTLGETLYVSPKPQIEKNEIDENKTSYKHFYFTKEDLKNTGINASFGDTQVLNFNLKYQLKNQSKFSGKYEIAIPSDIVNYQQINIQNITPKPTKKYLDEEKNIIAVYNLSPNEYIEVNVKGAVKLKTEQIDISKGGYFKDIPKDILKKYTKSSKYWESDNEIIKEIANNLYLKDENILKNAEQIYKYLVNNFSYDNNLINESYIQRKGAIKAVTLREPISCMEFTDIFIAIARAMNIPAKEVNGYAISQDNLNNNPTSINFKSGDVLHSWPMFYDSNYGWIQIDPTWGNTSKMDYFTKLDTNHFALVIRGTNSEYPLSAGMYRINDSNKLLDIAYANEDVEFTTEVTSEKIFNFSPIHFILGYNRYKITNTSNTITYNIKNKTLLPNESFNTYIKKDIDTLIYNDINNVEYFLNID